MKTQKTILLLILVLIQFNSHAFPESESIDSLVIKLDNAELNKDEYSICNYTYKLASAYLLNGDNKKSIEYCTKAISLAKTINEKTIQVNSISLYARILKQEGSLNASILKYEEAIEISKQTNDTILLANCIENLAVIYGSTGKTDYPKALELMLQSAKLKEEKKAWEVLAGTYKRISSIFKQLGDLENRETYLLKAVQLVDEGKINNISFQAAVYNEVGRYYSDENPAYNKAITNFEQVLKISETLNWKKGIAVSLGNIAYVKELQKHLDEALILQHKVLQLKTEINDQYGIANTNQSIALIHKKKKNFSKAIDYLNSSNNICEKYQYTSQQSENYKYLYELYRLKSNYKSALINYEKYTSLTDSLIGEKHKTVVAELETKYETQKKEQQINTLTTEKKLETLKANQRTIVSISLAIILIFLTLLFLFINRQNRLKRKRNESELNQRLFRTQMNPHFIFNALGSIQNYIYLNEPNEAAKFLASFSKLMRNILESSVTEMISLDQELNIVENYLILQRMRKEDTFEYTIEDKTTNELNIPPMLAQPFIENSINHAFKGINYKGKINVSYNACDTFLTIIVSDNGIGYSKNKKSISEHKSMAVDLTKKRLKLFKSKKINSTLFITNNNETDTTGTKVEIKLPLEKCLKF